MRILPRPFGLIVADAMAVLGRTWKTLVPVSIAVFVPAALASWAAYSIPGALEFVEAILLEPETLAGLPAAEFWERARPFVTAAVVTMVVQLLASVLVFLFCHRVVIASVREQPTGRASLQRVLRRYPVAAAATVLSAAAAFGLFLIGYTVWSIPATIVAFPNPTAEFAGTVLLFAFTGPGIWLAVSMSMVTPVASVEEKGVFASIRRSAALVRGRWWATLGFLLVVAMLGIIAVNLIQLVAIPVTAAGGGGATPIASLLGVLAQGPIVAAMGVMFTSWYLDLRARKEVLLVAQL
ncbi:MAG: hypothetical protein DIU67_000870 [Actinomycetes bacterium]|jgi:hypothetical protein|nr:MAG: hypothetical protein DIU67_04520 [Actinomycetota bacterium]